MGILISFEGTDGCGKSTQIRFLADYLTEKGYQVVVSREPGGSRIGENIRNILLSDENSEMDSLCELFLYEAARAQHMAEIVEPALKENKIVILDRFVDSSYAYQGAGRQLGEDNVDTINRIAVKNRMPDITFLLEISPKEAFKRKGGRDEHDRIELSGDDFFARVRKGFASAAEKYPERIVKIDASGTRGVTHNKIKTHIDKLLEDK